MCDQTEVTYAAGDVVWVKLGPVWWPGTVQDYEKLPEEITHDLRKRPIAVVKFFQEDTFEYVKNINHIYNYNCRKKEEFIKKGLDLVRSSTTRDVPSNMKMFPNDIVMAEHLTGGNPNILDDEAFAPEKKSDYKELFGTKKTSAKKIKAELLKKDKLSFKPSKYSLSPLSNNRKSLPVLPSTVPRPITHPRFITKALEGKSDHEVRIRCQTGIKDDDDSLNSPIGKKYKCYLCDYQADRINVIVLHNKSHSAGFIEAQNAMKARLKLKAREKDQTPTSSSSFIEKTPTVGTSSRGRVKSLPKRLEDYAEEPPTKIMREKISVKSGEPSGLQKKNSSIKIPKTPKKEKEDVDKKTLKRPLFGKRKSAKEKAELAAKIKQENDAMKEKLLMDWDDDEVNEDVELDQLKKALESTTSSSVDLDDSRQSLDDSGSIASSPKSPISTPKLKIPSNETKPVENKIDAKVFEFDDSEDSLPLNINFRLKKSEKFTDDKFKKPKPPKPLNRTSLKNKSSNITQSPPLTDDNKEKDDKEDVEINKAINAFLEETEVPSIPEIPKPSAIVQPTEISDQTSDISSSTDLFASPKSGEKSDFQQIQDLAMDTSQSDISIETERMECTSSDSEELISKDNAQKSEILEDQKNFFDVSATGPCAEMELDQISGVPSKINDQTSALDKDDSNVTEISSSCDVPKKDTKTSPEQTRGKPELFPTNEVCQVDNDRTNNETVLKNHEDVLFPIPDDSEGKNEDYTDVVDKESTCFSDGQTQNVQHSEDVASFNEDVIGTENEEHGNNQPNNESHSIDQEKETPPIQTNQNSTNVSISSGISLEQSEVLENSSTQEEKTSEIVEQNQNDSQVLTQNLQDMELDINSMPVIIGGEDFLPPELPKPSLVPIQPKYSESIVISPKSKTTSASKPVIMQLEGAPTSSQAIPSIISLPGKSGRGGKGSRGQKTPSKTIKLSASALKNLGIPQKAGNQQVLILKTTSGQEKLKGMTEKNKISLNMLPQGNKILLLNSPQLSGQSQIKLSSQQQLIAGGKLAPGTRFITSKVVASSSQGSSSPNKISISSSSASKPVQKLVISKGGITSKGLIINSGGKLVTTVTGAQTVSPSKAQAIAPHNILTTKGGLILPSTSTSGAFSNKTATIITSQAISSSKSMILTTVPNKGETIISGNQKLRIVSSKAPLKGTRLVVQNPQGKIAIDPMNKSQTVKLISAVGGQPTSNTIYIHPSQGIVTKSLALSSTTPSPLQQSIKIKESKKSATSSSSTKLRVSLSPAKQAPQVLQPKTQTIQPQIINQTQIIQQPQIVQQTHIIKTPQLLQQPQVVQKSLAPKAIPVVKKVTVPKSKQNPNILQKPRKSSSRTTKSSKREISPIVPASDQLILSSPSSVSGIAQPTIIQGQVPQSSDGLLYLTMDESGNYQQIDNKSLITVQSNRNENPQTIFIPSDGSTQDVGNIFLAIDEAGNLINISQPTSSTSLSAASAAPEQDILAKALANTQVLQQDMDVSGSLTSVSMDSTVLSNTTFSEQAQYPPTQLSNNVLETSLTLNQPIMTPLEVPSAITSNLSMPPSYVSSNILPKHKQSTSSVSLLTEEAMTTQTSGDSMFLLNSSNTLIPSTSGSQISFQFVDGNNVIMTSGAAEVQPSTYQVVSNDLLTPQLVQQGNSANNDQPGSNAENITYSILPETDHITDESTEQSMLLREALEGSQNRSENLTTSAEVTEEDQLHIADVGNVEYIEGQTESAVEAQDNFLAIVNKSDSISENKMVQEDQTQQHSLKRSFGEEQTVTSSSDMEDLSKRIRIDER